MVITNCILFIGSDDKELINDVNRFEGSGIGFIGLDNPSMPASFIHLRFVDTEVYVGRFPNLDITLLEEHFRSIPWTQLNRVQLLWKIEGDERFVLLNFDPIDPLDPHIDNTLPGDLPHPDQTLPGDLPL